MVNYTGNLIKSSISVLIFIVSTAFLGYLFRILLAKNLSITDFGLFFAVFAFINFLFGFKSFGLGSGVVRFITEEKLGGNEKNMRKIISSYFFLQVIISVLIIGFLFLFSNYLANNYFKAGSSYYLLIILAVSFIPTIITTVSAGVVHAFKKLNYLSSIEFLQTLFLLIFTYLFLSYQKGVLSPAYSYVVSFFIVSIWSIYIAIKCLPELKSKKWFILDKKTLIKLINFGSPVLIGSIGSSIILYFGTLSLTYFGSLSDVAFYSVALPTANLLRYIPRAITISFLPMSSELDLTNKFKLSSIITKLYIYILAILAPLSFLIFFYSEYIISLLFGENYSSAVPALKILLIAMVFMSLGLINQYLLLGLKKPKLFGFLLMSSAIVNVILNLILIPNYKITGAAYALLFTYIFAFILSLILVNSHIKLKLPYLGWIKIMFCTFLFISSVFYFSELIKLNFFIELLMVFLLLVLYLFLLVAFRVINISELNFIKKELMSIRTKK